MKFKTSKDYWNRTIFLYGFILGMIATFLIYTIILLISLKHEALFNFITRIFG